MFGQTRGLSGELDAFRARLKILGMSEDLARSLKEFLGTSYAFWIRLACLGNTRGLSGELDAFRARLKILGVSEYLAMSLKGFLGTPYEFWTRLWAS